MTNRNCSLRLLEGVLAGDARAVGRAMSLVEDGAPGASALLRGIAAHTGRAHLVGFTGPPGVGKSSLLAGVALLAREARRTVGIVAADPTSAFTGGALLGDRIRMQKLFEDGGVFIRSMATREHAASLPPPARDVCRVMDAMGKDLIFLETVGAGQGDIDVVRYVDTVVLVLSPATGDSIQAMKAGSMEIADIVALNKADLPGSERAVTDLNGFLQTRIGRLAAVSHPGRLGQDGGVSQGGGWRVSVVPTSAIKGEDGLHVLLEQIHRHAEHLRGSGELEERRRRRLRHEIADYCVEYVASRVRAEGRLDHYVGEVAEGRLIAGEAGRLLARDLMSNPKPAAGHDNGA